MNNILQRASRSGRKLRLVPVHDESLSDGKRLYLRNIARFAASSIRNSDASSGFSFYRSGTSSMSRHATETLVRSLRRPLRSPIRLGAFVLNASRLDSMGKRHAAMDLLYDCVDELMRTGQFEALDSIIEDLIVSRLTIDVLVGLLTATLPAKSRLRSRPEFFSKTDTELRSRHEYEDGLLTGLE